MVVILAGRLLVGLWGLGFKEVKMGEFVVFVWRIIVLFVWT